MKQFLEKHLKIYAHEASAFLWLSLIFFSIFFVFAIFRNYVDTAFLKRYGPDSIPWMLVINGLLTFVVFGVADRLARRFTDDRLLFGILTFYAVAVTAIFFTVKADISLSYPILYQLLHLLDSMLLVYLWNMAGDLFDARQGKRVFPLITAAQVLGTTLGSFGTRPISRLVGEDETLLIFGLACLATAVYMLRTAPGLIGRTQPKGKASKNTAPSKRLVEVPGLMKQFPIVRYLIITGLIPNILLPIFLYQFSVIANHTFASEQALMQFLSLFRGMTTLLTFVLLFFMGRLYSTMGLTNSSLVAPVNFAALFAGLAAFFNIYIASYGQFSAILIQRAIAGPVNKILFSIVPGELVAWSRTFIRGTVLKVGMLTGSLIMIVVKPVVDARPLALIAFVFAVYWVVETLLFRRHYRRILKQVIVEKEIDFDQIEAVRTIDSGTAGMDLGRAEVEDRSERDILIDERKVPVIEPEVALKLLDDPSPATRADAARSFALNQDIRAVRTLIRLLEETDDRVRNAAIEALITYRGKIMPFLEVSLLESHPRVKQGILEVMRLSGVKDFEMIPFLGKQLTHAYGNLIAIRQFQSMNGCEGVAMLKECLEEINEEILRLIFYALWVQHADMRLMYQALRSETASIAVELVENSIHRNIAPYLIPLIDDIPLDEKIEKGRELLPLMRSDAPDRLLHILAESEDPLTRMLALFVVADCMCDPAFIPVIESRLTDEDQYVRQLARYALARCSNEVMDMPEIIDIVNKLKTFSIFEGMGIRELHAIATVLNVETFQPGDILIKENEENSSLYLLVSGSVEIYSGYGTPTQQLKVTLGEGSFLGDLSMFTRLPPNATCRAAEITEAYVLQHHRFVEIMKVYPQIGINLCRFFSLKLRQASY
ncbi:MAG: HEAT repeat domain-containing protein [Desulfomonile sp.]|nr:HEAT repeat domain-containing protein [Desulfomonile sp.]